MAFVCNFYNPETDIELIGCLTQDELFNGSSAYRAKKAPKDPTLLSMNRLRANSTWPEYGRIIDNFRYGRIKERETWSRLSALGKIPHAD